MAEASQGSAQSPVSSADQAVPPESNDAALAEQSEIDDLLKQAQFEDPAPEPSPVAPAAASHDEHVVAASTGGSPHAEESHAATIAAEQFDLPSLDAGTSGIPPASLDLLRDVELNVKIELGRSRMLVEDVLRLAEGSVVELDKLAGDPVDVFVNDRLVARGEVLVLNDNFCVRVNEIVATVKEEGM
jgi:flagellar motor switch protein FliN/FliY